MDAVVRVLQRDFLHAEHKDIRITYNEHVAEFFVLLAKWVVVTPEGQEGFGAQIVSELLGWCQWCGHGAVPFGDAGGSTQNQSLSGNSETAVSSDYDLWPNEKRLTGLRKSNALCETERSAVLVEPSARLPR